jgi:glycosyltransferase involved in cell wall biosynthesis
MTSQSMPTVSAIVPTHNRSQTVLRALRSIYSQRIPVNEVIVIDDGSSDDTAIRVQAEFPGVNLISQTRHGVSHARNRGIDAAQGEWLAFLDSDDEWLPIKIESQLDAVRNNPLSRICHSNEIWIRNGRRVNPMQKHRKHGGWIFEHCLPRCAISPSSVLLHRSAVEEFGNFDENLPVCEDYDLWLRLTTTLPVMLIPEPLVKKYGGHADQLSRSRWGMDRYRIRSLEKLLATNSLTTVQEQQALVELTRKIDIYLAGARRRQKRNEITIYASKNTFYRGLLAPSSVSGITKAERNQGTRTCV